MSENTNKNCTCHAVDNEGCRPFSIVPSSTAVREMLWHTDTEAVIEKLSGLIEPCAVDTVKEIFADKCRKASDD